MSIGVRTIACLQATIWLLGASIGTFSNAPKSLAAASSTFGTAGKVELGLQGLMDLDKDDDTSVYLDTTLGYFIFNGVEVGLSVLQGTTRTGQRDTFGFFSEYNFANSTMFIPFGGMSFKHAAAPTSSEDGKDARVVGIYGGVKLLIASPVALSLTFLAEFADGDIYGLPGDRKSRNKEINIGFKFYL